MNTKYCNYCKYNKNKDNTSWLSNYELVNIITSLECPQFESINVIKTRVY